MRSHTLTLLALGGELLLTILALVWMSIQGLAFQLGPDGWLANIAFGLVFAVLFALANYALLRWAPDVWGVRSIRQLYCTTLRPLFAEVGPCDVVIIAVAAGIGEELLFRGALQLEVGLVPASVIFGLLHTGARGTFAFGCWVAVMGAALGGLSIVTDGLLAPIVAHAAYDAAAIWYLRWGSA